MADQTDFTPELTLTPNLDAAAAADALGTAQALNVVLLGAAARAGALGPVTVDDLADAVRALVNPRFVDLDLRALNL